MKKAVFLDRDGVIVALAHNPATGEQESPKTEAEFSIYPWAVEALKALKNAGCLNIVISNQPDYAKGKTSMENIKAMERRLDEFSQQEGGLIDECYYCYHHPDSVVKEYKISCECRKPGTLSVERACRKYGIDKGQSWFVGDRDSDILCGKRAGLCTIRITGGGAQESKETVKPDFYASTLLEAVEIITNARGTRPE
jgi:D-glycero-D-manno-heptose 1,7-bisphosphate phosphatase